MNYKNVEIKMEEAHGFSETSEMTVTANNGLVYKASCKYGAAYATVPTQAINLIVDLIDQNQ